MPTSIEVCGGEGGGGGAGGWVFASFVRIDGAHTVLSPGPVAELRFKLWLPPLCVLRGLRILRQGGRGGGLTGPRPPVVLRVSYSGSSFAGELGR